MISTALCDLETGEGGIIIDHASHDRSGARLAELGLAIGESVHVMHRGSPMLLKVGESRLCVRTDEAQHIVVLHARSL